MSGSSSLFLPKARTISKVAPRVNCSMCTITTVPQNQCQKGSNKSCMSASQHLQGHSAPHEPLHCDRIAIMFSGFLIIQTRGTINLWVEQNRSQEILGKGISTVTAIIIGIGKGDLHHHSTNLKRGGVNSLCTMHYMRMK